ncbi:MAG: DVU_1555 family C-GCAxxG-C-C protein [Suipraeoptans sp.]
MELRERIDELLKQGYHCSQIMMQLSLDLRQKEEPFTMRALGALGGGMFAQRTCGTLTGGVAMLSSYFKRDDNDPEPVEYRELAKELVERFEETNGSLECRELVEFNMESIMSYCPALLERTFIKCLEILEEHGIDPNE